MQDAPTPELISATLTAYQRAEALKTAIELDLFTRIGEGSRSLDDLTERCRVSRRGMRILSDYLVVMGLLAKDEHEYTLSEQAALFLDRRSPQYMGDAAGFLASPALKQGFASLTEAVRKGGTAADSEGTVAQDHGVWIEFALGMAPLMAPTAAALADIIEFEGLPCTKVLDVAAGHGLFGIALGVRHPAASIVALDWSQVLEVASFNAKAAGIGERYETIPGSALEVDLGQGYDIALVTNLFHHFDRSQCVQLMRKVHQALDPGGRMVALELVPDDGRVSPAHAAGFALVMLATTPAGDAYTFSEYESMLGEAGFAENQLIQVEESNHQVIISKKT